ncbi:hypothetical protein ABB37_00652 [Leptomonas pyrrhocoris]|uniref:Uncharacterized protein n=1 Tax=Leptomonas pyrrhocoris TaxID=157538 RepID=A0A0N0VHS6_LEPPY|nr:hypothetical protein ABB37_00652 [Leptomonas pyrrhocoris]KPA86504.1 hypothetical protein ABB37_00652 [Leptomonas pyrrhocoris]|eukprot:XP_015664943.1 hypothetical protein ABB37_00652 [Leptomonas pyrrhocoris]
MFNSARLFVLSALYYFGFTYAAYTALKQRVAFVEVAEPTGLSSNGQAPHRNPTVRIGIPALKLMIMLTSMALLSVVGAEWFPLFTEMRVIFMYTLLFSPPFTQHEMYDQLFAPLLIRGGTFVLSLQTSNFLSRKVPLFVVRCCVDVGIAAMNYAQRRHAVDEDAVRDVVSGLVFSKRALHQVADLSREADGATYAEIARESNFAVGVFTSRVKRALLNEHAADEVDGGVPTGRVVWNVDSLFSQGIPVVTASSATFSADPPVSGGGADGLVDSNYRERDFQGSREAEAHRDGRSRRDKSKKHKLFGLF